jgi:hypothetical protein
VIADTVTPAWLRAVDGSRLAPIEEQVPLTEIPVTANLYEGVKVSEGSNHDLAVAVVREEVVGDRVALAASAVLDHGLGRNRA